MVHLWCLGDDIGRGGLSTLNGHIKLSALYCNVATSDAIGFGPPSISLNEYIIYCDIRYSGEIYGLNHSTATSRIDGMFYVYATISLMMLFGCIVMELLFYNMR